MKQDKLSNLFDFLPKSKVKAGDGLDKGKYPFYTSSENQSKYLNEFQHEPGCLVFGTGGKASVHFTTSRFATSTDCITIRPKPQARIDAGYVFQFFKGNMQVLESGFKGAGLKHISKAYLSNIQIPHPEEIDDQKRIAHLLGKVEGLIARRKHHLQQLDDLLKSVFLEMFGDPITNPRKFPVRKLSEFYINPKEGTKCGPFGSALKKDELVDSGIPVWNMDNIDPTGRMILPFRMWITEEKHKELVSYSVIDGDIIISRAGTVGKMCVARMNGEPAIISTNLIRLRLGDKLRPLHVVSLMTYCKGRVGRLKTGADGAFTHMNTGILDKLEFPYPPTELQDQFAAIVDKVDTLKSRYQQNLADLESLYGALSQKAFKGELDLSQVMLPAEGPEVFEEEKTDVEEKQPMESLFELPAPEELALLQTAEGRKSLLGEWLNAWLEHLGDAPFAAQVFMDAARQRLWELAEDEAPDWGVAEYDELKSWVFEALEQGRLIQGYDDANNRVQITAVKG
jgi:type I restriction enzyme S subunit